MADGAIPPPPGAPGDAPATAAPAPVMRPERPSPKPTASDWPVQAADLIERTVGTVRDKTTGPAITAARALVYGTFALLVGITVVVMLTVSAVRLLDVYLPDAAFGHHHTWVAHSLIGALLCIAGMALWSRRRPRRKAE